METSIFIARLMGPLVIVVGLTALITPKWLQEVAQEFLASRALIFLAGVMALLIGLAVVNTHNIWTAGWPVIITLFGWLAIAGGILRIGFPALTKSLGEAMLAKQSALRGIAACQVALGAYLSFVGYF